MIEKRCFLQSFMVTLAYAVAAFFAWRYGLLQAIWYSDTTYMTSVIGVIFVAAVGYLNFAAWRYDGRWNRWRDSSRTPTSASVISRHRHRSTPACLGRSSV